MAGSDGPAHAIAPPTPALAQPAGDAVPSPSGADAEASIGGNAQAAEDAADVTLPASPAPQPEDGVRAVLRGVEAAAVQDGRTAAPEPFHVEPSDRGTSGPSGRRENHSPEELVSSQEPGFHVEPPKTDQPAQDERNPASVVSEVSKPVEPTSPAPVVAPAPMPRPDRALPRVLAVANQKGGVGKTTTAVNLGAALAELGYRTLVVDLDPQGNATTGLGINAQLLETSVYDVLMRELPIEDALEPTSVRNLFVVPATIDLAGAEIELVPAFSRELRLKRALDAAADDFDFTLIDCPPSLGLLTVNALAAASEVVVPVQCEYYALEGLSALLRNVQLVQSNLNKGLEVSTIILTMYDARTKLAEQVANEVRSHFGNVVCRHLVPRTVRLSEAPSFGQPIIVFDPTSRGAIAYRELAKEVSGGSPQRIG